jgi:ferredoxin
MNKKIVIVISLLVLNLLTSCDNEINEWEHNEVKEINSEIEEVGNIENKDTQKISQWNNDISKQLTINDKCIWCSKCVIIAPDNFAMDRSTFRAVVISQKDIFSKEVTKSIQVCPVDSIKII